MGAPLCLISLVMSALPRKPLTKWLDFSFAFPGNIATVSEIWNFPKATTEYLRPPENFFRR
jgi:hypothetical protein